MLTAIPISELISHLAIHKRQYEIAKESYVLQYLILLH